MDDAVLLALCLWSEAAGEPDAGKQAVAQVVMNRMRDHYESDGTISGTVLRPDQFSGFYFDFVGGKYTRVCWTVQDAEHRAASMLLRAQHQAIWDNCMAIAEGVLNGSVAPSGVLDRAVLYLNPAILQRLPAWASPANQLAVVGHHTFYAAEPVRSVSFGADLTTKALET